MTVVTVEAAKAHLHVTDDAENPVIASKIEAAEAYVDRWLDVKLADMTPVPADLKEAILQLVGHLYENREATLIGVSAEELPLGFRDIIDQHRAWGF